MSYVMTSLDSRNAELLFIFAFTQNVEEYINNYTMKTRLLLLASALLLSSEMAMAQIILYLSQKKNEKMMEESLSLPGNLCEIIKYRNGLEMPSLVFGRIGDHSV